ncbi:hypothetical protein PUMCH_002106 [Australozyma saopauloensis]|uniref:Uncharacterized protein n=1 Tax=Australozyma saopauloensis TaxID=291208 RepID=A0AAX4H8E4_9ASCO|nr:hypothetical protein PUMCH_002106 [[Candida] saopauloensis]
MSLHSLLVMLRLPLDLVVVVLRYYIFGGLRFRKFNKSLLNCLKLRVYRTSLQVDMMDGKYLFPYSNRFLIRKIIPFIARELVKDLPGYGELYDPNLMWLVKQEDRKSSDPIIIFSHGGGYFIQTAPLQIKSVLSVYRLLDYEKRRRTSILFLDYNLISEGYPFPHQLHQLHKTYSKLVSEKNDNIILMGDSAGGHLSISYTQFLRTVSAPVVYPLKMVLISPWVKLSPLPEDLVQGKSWNDNEHYDMIHHSRFASMLDLRHLIGTSDPFSIICSPGGKTPRTQDDWNCIPLYSDDKHDIFLILGEDESFRDDVLQWAKYAIDLPWFEKIKYGNLHEFLDEKHYQLIRRGEQGKVNLSVFIEPHGVHDSMLYFEDVIASDVSRKLKSGKLPNVRDYDRAKYFGIVRLVEFLNSSL